MTVWSRNDVAAVTISAAHGGCGTTHSRPVEHGAPVKTWALTCNDGCEDFLRNDGLWSSTISELPETHDEKIRREDFEKRGALDERKLMAMALATLTGIEIPETIAGAISGMVPHIPGVMECPNGHGQPAGARFCNECGSPMSQPAAKAAIPGPESHAQTPPDTRSQHQGPRPKRLRDANLATLTALAKDRGLSENGNRAELIARLASAGVTSADLQRFTEREPAGV